MGGPSGTVTFLFTDIEGSTQLWESSPESMQDALEAHDRIVKDAVEARGGYVFATGGDGFAAAFSRAGDAMGAADAARAALEGHVWPADAVVRVRMAMHTGEAVERDGDYFGPAVNRTARLLATAHGGQVVCSQATAAIVGASSLVALGEHRLRDLGAPEQVFQVGDGSFPPLRSLDARPTNLPVQRTSFVGRERELKVTLEAIDRSPLVTLTGVGGVGKTRLALEAAAHLEHLDGAWLVELAPVADPDAVAQVTASALGVQQRPGESPSGAVVAFLRQRRLLLVIDNCEHLIDSVAALVDEVLASCPRVRVLATSREALGVTGEQIVPVPTLSLATDSDEVSDALRLLVDRALTVRPDFTLTTRGRSALVEICRRLDGIPLAIELAAARLRSMTPEELAGRLDQRFRLLVGSNRIAVNRQRTLRSTIDWSYDLLDSAERGTFQRVAVFAGGFDLAAAEALCADIGADVLDTLTRLADKSLLTADAVGPSTRYRMLETIRDYAVERLRDDQDIDAVRRAHADYFARWSAEAGAGLRGTRERDWLDVIELEVENLRTALLWAIDAHDLDLSVGIVTPLMLEILPIDDMVGVWAELCLAIPGIEEHPSYPQLAAFAAYVLTFRGRFDEGRALNEAARRALAARPSNAATLVRVLTSEMISATSLSGYDEATRIAKERLEAARETGDDYELCRGLGGYASVAVRAGTEIGLDARRFGEEAVAIARRLGNPLLLSSSLFALGNTIFADDPRRAMELYTESEAHAAASGNDRMLSVLPGLRMQLLMGSGDLAGASQVVVSMVEFEWVQRRHLHYSLLGVANLGSFLAASGHEDTAALLEGVCVSRSFVNIERIEGLAERLGEERYAELYARGAAMSEAEVVHFVRAAAAELS